jgi:hypothetical protein
VEIDYLYQTYRILFMSKKRLPWDLLPSTFHLVEISQVAYSVMSEGNDDEKLAINLIDQHWQDSDVPEGFFGLKMPSRHGWTGPESKKLDPAAAQQRAGRLATEKAIEKIHIETNIDLEEVRKHVGEVSTTGVFGKGLEYLKAFQPDFDEINILRQQITWELCAATTLMQRIIPNWNMQLTEALHQSIASALRDVELAEIGGVTIEPAPKSAPSDSSEPESSSSLNTESQTGTPSSSTSSTGAKELVAVGE